MASRCPNRNAFVGEIMKTSLCKRPHLGFKNSTTICKIDTRQLGGFALVNFESAYNLKLINLGK